MGAIFSEAFFLTKKGEANDAFDLRKFELNLPVGTEVLIEVESFGLNYADVMARKGLYREAPAFPCIVGYEVVGKIAHVGPDADQSKLGNLEMEKLRYESYYFPMCLA